MLIHLICELYIVLIVFHYVNFFIGVFGCCRDAYTNGILNFATSYITEMNLL